MMRPRARLRLAIERGLPLVFNNYGMSGATAPITPGGTLALLNAELLAGLVYSQLLKTGAPIILGSLPAGFDMRTMASLYTPPHHAAQPGQRRDDGPLRPAPFGRIGQLAGLGRGPSGRRRVLAQPLQRADGQNRAGPPLWGATSILWCFRPARWCWPMRSSAARAYSQAGLT